MSAGVGRARLLRQLGWNLRRLGDLSLQTLNLVQDGEWLGAGGNILLSVALCLLGVWLGHAGALLINE